MRRTNESQSSPTADGPCMRQGLNCRELSALHPRAENYAPEMTGAWEVINPKCNSEFPDRWGGEERATIREDGTETFRCRHPKMDQGIYFEVRTTTMPLATGR